MRVVFALASSSPEVACRSLTKATEAYVLSRLLPPWLLRAFLFSLLTRSLQQRRWFKGEASTERAFPVYARLRHQNFLPFPSLLVFLLCPYLAFFSSRVLDVTRQELRWKAITWRMLRSTTLESIDRERVISRIVAKKQ